MRNPFFIFIKCLPLNILSIFPSVTFHHQAHKENYSCFCIKIWDCSTWEWQCCTYSTKLLVFKKPNDWLVVTNFLYLTDLPIRHLIFKGNASYFQSFDITGTVSETLMEKYSSEERSNISLQLPLRILNLFFFFWGGAAEQKCLLLVMYKYNQFKNRSFFTFDSSDNKLLRENIYISRRSSSSKFSLKKP